MKRLIFASQLEVAAKAAEDAVETLNACIETQGKVNWVLAGGTSPMKAYEILAKQYADAVDWSKVTMFIGDERCVPLDHPESNWGQISNVLFSQKPISGARQVIPQAYQGAELGAQLYNAALRTYAVDDKGDMRIDLLWLGVGEDGHTLSLFPNHPGFADETEGYIAIHDSPKPPSDRITLSFGATIVSKKIVIFAVGGSKREALSMENVQGEKLPIRQVASEAEKNGADVLWLYDEAAISGD